METERIRVEGMSCGHCVARVKAALEGVNGVEVQAVEIGEATVRLDPAGTDLDRVKAAIREVGFAPR